MTYLGVLEADVIMHGHQLLMVSKLVCLLALGNNKLPRELGDALLKNSCRPQQCTSLDQFDRNAYLNGSRLLNICGSDPNPPTTTETTFALTPLKMLWHIILPI